jgi:hypothetical protein
MLIANTAVALLYLFGTASFQSVAPGMDIPSWAFIVLAILAIVNIVSAIALWMWQKWGFYAFVVTSIAAVVINLAIGIPILNALLGLIGLAILWYLLRDKWEYMT